MRQGSLQRRLTAVTDELRTVREELRILDEQLSHHRAVTAESQTRALVDGTPLSRREHGVAADDLRRAERDRDSLAGRLAALARQQDDLLDQMARQLDGLGAPDEDRAAT